MTSTRTILRAAIAAGAITIAAFTVPATASASTTAPLVTAGFVQSDAGVAIEQAKFKKKFFGRKQARSHHRGHTSRFNRFGHRQHGVAGVGHGRSLTGASRFDHYDTYGQRQRGGHSGRVIKKGIFPFGFVIVK